MAQQAVLYDTLEARLVTGRVLSARNGIFQVLTGNVAHEASLAASCFLEPRNKDTVLLACLENGANVITAVLCRDDAASARVLLPPQSLLECPGELSLRSASSLELQSGGSMRLKAEDIGVFASCAAATVTKLKTICDTAELCCRAMTSLGQTAVSMFRSLTQCLGESRRMVEGSDETHCANATLVAEEKTTVMSKDSLQLAEETARTDAKLIQLG